MAQLEADKDIKYVEFDSRMEISPDDDDGRARRYRHRRRSVEPYWIEMVLEDVAW